MSKILSNIISNENKKTDVSRKIVCFGILIHVLSWRQQKHQCLCFHYWDFLTKFWHNNWWAIFDVVEKTLFIAFILLGLYYKYGALMDDVTQPGIHWMQPFVTEMKALRLTPETEIMNPMVCTTRDGVRNVFRDVQVSFLMLLFSKFWVIHCQAY